MGKTMTPSKPITDGQIDKAVDLYRAMLQNHRAELGSEEVQRVLGQSDYVTEQVEVLRRRVEAVINLIVRCVKVNRGRTPQETLDATDRRQYTDRNVVDAIPRGKGEEVEVIFFNVGRFVSDNELEKEFALRSFKPADPYEIAAVNEADPAFADEHPNGTHWKDVDGRWCYVAFDRWRDVRNVDVLRDDDDWPVHWWFAGVRK